VNRAHWLPNENSRKCSTHFVDGWHSDDPDDVNYRPTLFSYKEKVESEKELHRTNRIVKRSLLQVINLPHPLPTPLSKKKKVFLKCSRYPTKIWDPYLHNHPQEENCYCNVNKIKHVFIILNFGTSNKINVLICIKKHVIHSIHRSVWAGVPMLVGPREIAQHAYVLRRHCTQVEIM
jgi:hypothetical protein